MSASEPPSPALAWRIYYGDGRTFSSEDGAPAAAPALDVQAIVKPDDEVGRILLSRCDFYWYETEDWQAGDLFGLFDFLMRSVGPVKFGRAIATPDFRRIYTRASRDPDFRPKSAFKDGERRP